MNSETMPQEVVEVTFQDDMLGQSLPVKYNLEDIGDLVQLAVSLQETAEDDE